jgi:hypothetical protein
MNKEDIKDLELEQKLKELRARIKQLREELTPLAPYMPKSFRDVLCD